MLCCSIGTAVSEYRRLVARVAYEFGKYDLVVADCVFIHLHVSRAGGEVRQ